MDACNIYHEICKQLSFVVSRCQWSSQEAWVTNTFPYLSLSYITRIFKIGFWLAGSTVTSQSEAIQKSLLSTLDCSFDFPLHWRHNDYDDVSNYQPHGCLLNCLFRRKSKKTSKLRVTGLCVRNSPGPVNSPHKGPVTRKMFPFDDVIMFVIRVLEEYRNKWHTNPMQIILIIRFIGLCLTMKSVIHKLSNFSYISLNGAVHRLYSNGKVGPSCYSLK